jgi:hypothetical protein
LSDKRVNRPASLAKQPVRRLIDEGSASGGTRHRKMAAVLYVEDISCIVPPDGNQNGKSSSQAG